MDQSKTRVEVASRRLHQNHGAAGRGFHASCGGSGTDAQKRPVAELYQVLQA